LSEYVTPSKQEKIMMRKILWIAGVFLILSISMAACGGQETPAPPTAAPTQPPAQTQPTAQPTAAPAQGESESETESESEGEAVEMSPSEIFSTAMQGVETNVERFLEGFPMPEGAAITIIQPERVEFIQGFDVPTSIEWARDTYTGLGLIEIPELGFETENSASMWFGGYPTGQAIQIRIQRVTDGTSTFRITFEDL
jgi:hypothetical protein